MAENTLVWGAEKCGKNGRLVVGGYGYFSLGR